ncbi:hypothetical protein K08M3_18790 [Vibrio alginolyticus]|uniref:Molecular chaperone n=1 Tax=Vibrio alginolyticus TaxID=663 RepID=A0A1W6TSA7_VIBAL|nr:hypothetical protein [Vibrio alginolyticus]ARO98816.1 hypothetical protein K01M1_18750 [Vibrio alginolyticus]ARP03532.1 hypothetical protein K04M1_18880 [Vibrio alginolyticus]ARP08592.1 hypothetical protein K04M3_18910 [Vibrio alginolyticus]ARP13667.1 hypothetical protein K04M5_18790 [Vibrio alginolyticus]ARP18727.1 hypothetical protein K05K4_18930 [Vibrio alginolyticus]
MIRLIFIFFSINYQVAFAFNVGPLVTNLDSEIGFISKMVSNESQSRKAYQIKVYEIEKPGKDEKLIKNNKNELRYSPKTFFLSANSHKYISFYYRGNKKKEKYYRVTFSELSTSILKKSIEMSIVTEINTIVIVLPENKRLKYDIDYENGKIINSGNVYFELLLKERCDSKDSDSFSRFLLPDDYFEINLNKKIVIIKYNGRYIDPQGTCSNEK